MLASAHQARLAVHVRLQTLKSSRVAVSSTTASTLQRFARPRAQQCSPVAITMLSVWAASPRSPRQRLATTRCVPTPVHHLQRSSNSTATQRHSLVNATKYLSSKRLQSVHTTTGPPALASNTSTDL